MTSVPIVIKVNFFGERHVVLERSEQSSTFPVLRGEVRGGVMLSQNFRRDGTFWWEAYVEYPEDMDPGDGYGHTLSADGESAQQALDALREKAERVAAWARKMVP